MNGTLRKEKERKQTEMTKQNVQTIRAKVSNGKVTCFIVFPPVRFSLCTGASVKSRKYLAMRVDGLNFFRHAYELYKKKEKKERKKNRESYIAFVVYPLSFFFSIRRVRFF